MGMWERCTPVCSPTPWCKEDILDYLCVQCVWGDVQPLKQAKLCRNKQIHIDQSIGQYMLTFNLVSLKGFETILILFFVGITFLE